MSQHSPFVVLAAVLCMFSLVACGDSESLMADVGVGDVGAQDGGAAQDAGAVQDAGVVTAITIRGELRDMPNFGFSQDPLPSASICVVQPAGGPCATSDATGAYELDGVAANAEILLEIVAQDRPPHLLPLETREASGSLTIPAISNATLAIWGGAVGGLDTTKGVILLQLAAAEVTATITPDDGVRTYRELAGDLNPNLMRSVSDGFAVFLNVTPGEHVVTADHASRLCNRGLVGWPATNPESARVPVRAGAVTRATLACRP